MADGRRTGKWERMTYVRQMLCVKEMASQDQLQYPLSGPDQRSIWISVATTEDSGRQED
jgi:hypothetical protein